MSKAAAAFVLLAISLCPSDAWAQEDAFDACLSLSFAPLDHNVPACSALIDGPAALDSQTRAAVLAARARAYEFALTYRGDSDVADDMLLASALADLDRAVAADPSFRPQRAGVLHRLGRFADAVQDYDAAIAAAAPSLSSLLSARSTSLAAQGRQAEAIDDMTAAIRLSTSPSQIAGFLFRRGELREGTGAQSAALADYQAVLALQPHHGGARAAVTRLSASDGD